MLLLHAACRDAVLSRWETPPGIVVPLVVSAVWYAVGVQAMRMNMGPRTLLRTSQRTSQRTSPHASPRGLRNWEIACFVAGWLTLVVALVSPLHPLGEQLFSAHMVQHTLLMTVAAPLLVLGRPLLPYVWALPRRWRRPIGRWMSHGPLTPLWRTVTHPIAAWIIQAIVLCGWHVPALYSVVLRSESVHALQHICFLVASLLFWWTVLQARAVNYGTAVISLFTTAMYSGALGALITVAPVAWYPIYKVTAPIWGLTALQDQQLAGLIMWIPGGIAYLIAALVLFVKWLQASDARVARQTVYGFPNVAIDPNV